MPTEEAHLIRDDLYARVLLAPAADGCDGLRILAGYASPAFALFHQLEMRQHLSRHVSVDLHIGMTGEDGLDVLIHRGFQSAMNALTGGWLRVRYAPRGVSDHSKLYVWTRNGIPDRAWAGSSNYSHQGFGIGTRRRETLVEVDPADATRIIASASDDYVDAKDAAVTELVDVYEVVSEMRKEPARALPTPISIENLPSVRLPLVQSAKSPGQVHNAGAGLNWGHRGSRRRSESYIPVPSAVARSGFFPPHGEPFTVYADDGEVLFLAVAQGGDKALQSVPDNATIGLWFRRRLGLEPESFVETADLERYGSKSVVFYRRDDGAYVMVFTPALG